jgi:hypothetical protein
VYSGGGASWENKPFAGLLAGPRYGSAAASDVRDSHLVQYSPSFLLDALTSVGFSSVEQLEWTALDGSLRGPGSGLHGVYIKRSRDGDGRARSLVVRALKPDMGGVAAPTPTTTTGATEAAGAWVVVDLRPCWSGSSEGPPTPLGSSSSGSGTRTRTRTAAAVSRSDVHEPYSALHLVHAVLPALARRAQSKGLRLLLLLPPQILLDLASRGGRGSGGGHGGSSKSSNSSSNSNHDDLDLASSLLLVSVHFDFDLRNQPINSYHIMRDLRLTFD